MTRLHGRILATKKPSSTPPFSFGASSTLATQITQGAPADVFASASTKNMDSVVTAHAATAPQTFAKNVMQVAVPPTKDLTQLTNEMDPKTLSHCVTAGLGTIHERSPSTVDGTLQAFADTMIPEAFHEAHNFAGLITVAGFLTAFYLTKLGA